MEKKTMTIKTLDPNNPRVTYTTEHDNMNPAQAWAAWTACKITVFQFSEWQQRHNYYFNSKGARVIC